MLNVATLKVIDLVEVVVVVLDVICGVIPIIGVYNLRITQLRIRLAEVRWG